LTNPFGSPGIGIIRIDILFGVNHSLVDALQAVRLLADTFDEVDLYVPPLQQSCGLPFAWAGPVCTFRFRMKFVFGHNVTVGLYTSGLPCPAVTLCRDAEPPLAGMAPCYCSFAVLAFFGTKDGGQGYGNSKSSA